MIRLLRNPEVRGVAALLLIILVIGAGLAATNGSLEKWFNITFFTGPRALNKIVFVSERSGTSELYLMNHDGSEQKQLTQGARVHGVPAVSPLGNRIVFVAFYDGNSQIYSCSARGGNAEPITSATGTKACPLFSPNGKNFSYIASGKVYLADINGESPHFVLPSETELQTAMTSRGEIPAYVRFVWGQDNNCIMGVIQTAPEHESPVYLPSMDGQSQAMPMASGGVVQIPGLAAVASERKFVFSASVKHTCLLVLFDPSGSNIGLMKFTNAEIGIPCVSPNGREAVVPVKPSAKGMSQGLFAVSLADGTQRLIAIGDFSTPAYSPDGSHIMATQISSDGAQNVVTIDSSTGDVTNLTTDGKSFNAVYTPVSTK